MTTGEHPSTSAPVRTRTGTRTHTGSLRLVLAAALLLSFHAGIAVSLLLWATLVLGAFHITTFASADMFPGMVFLFPAGTAPLVYILLKSAHRSLFFVDETPDASTDPAAHEAPALHALVRALTVELHITEPVTLRLTGVAAARMTDEGSRHLGLSPGRNVLSVGLPLLAVLTREQVRAVVAHELAHLALGHHRSRAFTARLETSLAAFSESMTQLAEVNRFVAMYAGYPRLLVGVHRWLFRGLVQPLRRRQELEADALAATVCEAPVLADALAKSALADVLWPHYRRTYLEQGPEGFLPADPFPGFARIVAAPGMRPGLQELQASLFRTPAATASELGASHPDLAVRCRHLMKGGPFTAPVSFRPDGDFLPDLVPTQTAWLLPEAGYGSAMLLPWEKWVERWRDARFAPALLAAARDRLEPGRPACLHEVLRLLEAGERMPLARGLAERLPKGLRDDGEPLAVLAEAVLALVRTGPAGRAAAGPRLESLVVDAVRQPREVSRLVLFLSGRGIDVHEQPGAEVPPAPQRHRTDDSGQSEERVERARTVGVITIGILLAGLAIGGLLWSGRGEQDASPARYGGTVTVPTTSEAPFGSGPLSGVRP
ncbi:M48 family metallopeptidase [Streptomyces yangpuensis]|uniref:M48 family metallopeptidase n=1 Tax=Streptomyces yangpuensis TaxID=1648182 RepID=UPI0006290F8F|nr:M48 family metallopeptidase [Streptomyces yangpuensis]